MVSNKAIYIVILCCVLFGCNAASAERNLTATLSPTPEIINTPLPKITNTTTPSQTATLPPTLTPKQADIFFKELLWNNPDCIAPCFMGITPEQTTLEEINILLIPLGPFYSCDLNNDKTGRCRTSHRFSTGLSITIRMSIESGIVKNLQIPVTLPEEQDGAAQQEWLAITPESLIKEYGIPSKVNIFADLGPTPTYAIDLYFDANDMIYSYGSYDFGVDMRICPKSDRFEGIRIWMGKNPINPPLETVSLEEATTMTREEFSNLLTSDIDGACFILNKVAFP